MKNPLYNKYAKEYSEVIKNNVYNSLFDRPNLCKMLPELNNKNVLDLGCGSGEYTKILLEHKAKVTAVDNSEKFIEILKLRFPNTKSYVQDLNKGLPQEKDNEYDLVISPLVIHYIEDLEQLFSEVSRVLKKNGKFIFSTHSPIADAIYYKPENYYKIELIDDSWETIGKQVEVKFYRRSLTALFQPLLKLGFVISKFSEGNVSRELQQASEKSYKILSTQPNFIYVEVIKIR